MAVDVASGTVSLSYTDASIPGAFPMEWKRRYSTNILEPDISPLGKGWAGNHYARLGRFGNEWRLITGTGALVRFSDPERIVERGGLSRDPGSYHEISKQGAHLRVTHWDADSHEVTCYRFLPERNGIFAALQSVENLSGHGLEFSWGEKGLLKGIRQRLEKRTLILDHNAAGLVVEVSLRRSDGSKLVLAQYGYDERLNLISAKDANGNVDRFEYDREGRMLREIAKDGGVFAFRYDDAGRCVRTWGLDNYDLKIIRFYDATGRSEITDSYGFKTQYELLPSGQVKSELNPMGGLKVFEYDDFGRLIKTEDSLSRVWAYEYDEGGNRVKTVDPMGSASQFTFNSDHQAISHTDANGGEWEKVFDADRRVIATSDPCGAEWKFAYHQNGRPSEIRNPLGPTMRFEYQPNGDLASIRDWDELTWKYHCDDFGRISRIENPAGRSTTSIFDPVGNLIAFQSCSGAKYAFKYDPKGRRKESVGPDGQSHRRIYGSCGRLSEIISPAGSQMKYRWGTEPNRLLAMMNARGETYEFKYDGNGRKIHEKGFDCRETVYRRNAFGECLATGADPMRMIRFDLDRAGRIIGKILPEGAQIRYAYDAMGRMVAAENAECKLEFTRDPLGRVVKEMQGAEELQFEYDGAGNLIKFAANSGMSIEYGYPEGRFSFADLNRSHRIGFGKGGATDPVTRSLPGSIEVSHRLGDDGRAILQSIRKDGSGIADRRFSWGADGKLSQVIDSRQGKRSYGYDHVGRLCRLIYPDGGQDRIEFDEAGNYSRFDWSDGTVVPVAIGPDGRLLARGEFTFEYDAAGRMKKGIRKGIQPGHRAFEWDDLDQLIAFTDERGVIWTYGYDPLGRRVRKTGPSGETRYTWFRHVIARKVDDNGKVSEWMFAPNGFVPLAQASDAGSYSIITDPNGTPLELLDSSGFSTSRISYDLLGRADQDGNIVCDLRFPGQWFDEESGLHYNRFRYYDPGSARYISQDPIGLRGGFRPYDYGGDPLNWVDPLGLMMLFRGMKTDAEGKPVVYSGPASPGNNAADSLGVRPEEDGMSTNTDPAAIQDHRKPVSFGGKKADDKNAMFVIDSDELAKNGLVHDPDHDSHVSIKTAPGEDPATLGDKLAATKELWKPVTPEEAEKIREEEAKKQGGCNG